jgi:hypothetical protein
MYPRFTIIVALLSGVASAEAQEAVPVSQAQAGSGTGVAPAASDTSSILLAPKPPDSPGSPVPTPQAAHPASSDIAAEIDSSLPKYSPIPATAKEAAVAADARDFDKPKNVIPRLPLAVMNRYVVHEARMPVFRDRDLYTTEGLIALSFKAHPGLRIGNFFNLNSRAAYAAIQKDEKYAARLDMVDTAYAMAVGGDSGETDVVKDAIEADSFRNGGYDGPVGIK